MKKDTTTVISRYKRGTTLRTAIVSVVAGMLMSSICFGQTPGSITSQPIDVVQLLRANSYELTVSDNSLVGSGLEFLLKASERSQFFAIGEPHDTRELPEITTLLFKALKERHGFNYAALEQDPIMTRIVSEPGVVGNRDYVISFAKKFPNAFTFDNDQELDMIAALGSLATGKADRIWGLDQVFGPVHALNRLAEFAPNPDLRDRTAKLAQVLQKIEAEYAKNQKRYNLAAVENMDEITRLLDEYHPKAGSEAEFLISQILISARIYRNNRDANAGKLTGLASNYEREENMKTLFMLEYRKAQAAGDPLPKVILKTGHNHAIRGRSTSNVLALGNFLSEFAKSNGLESFHLATYRNNAAGDFGVLANIPDLKPFADAAPKDKWIVIDVRPLREYVHAGKLTAITTPEFRRVVMGFDAVLLIGNAKPATFRSTQEQ